MDFVEQLKSSIDIVSVIGERVRLRRMGSSGRYTGLCPFHNEKTPSFSVNATHQYFKCFGCGMGGDVLKFVMEIDGLSFYEALKQLAEQHGIPMPKRSEYSDPDTRLRAAIHQMHELAERTFQANLAGPAGSESRGYLARRGVSPEMIQQFALGYADGSGQTLVRLFEKQGFSAEQMEASGLVRRRDSGGFYDYFRNRLMFPIHNESGKPIAFGARALAAGDEPKYINSPETPIYRKSYVLYNLHRAKEAARKNGRVVLVEGYMDVVGVFAAGVKEVVASCGTALRPQQVQSIRRHCSNIIVNFDPDAAGASAAERHIQLLLEEGMHVRVVDLEDGLDPDEYCRQHGAETYRARLDQAKNYFYWLADRARTKFDMRSAEGRVAAFQFLLPAVQSLGDKIERVAVANDVAGYLGVDSGLVLENFRKAAAERSEKRLAAVKDTLRIDEKILLNLLLVDAEARRRLIPELQSAQAVEQFATRRIFRALFALEASGGSVSFAALDARLEENDRELLASAALSGETNEEILSLENGIRCLDRMRKAAYEARIASLQAQLKQAERGGNLEEAMRLAEEVSRLKSDWLPGKEYQKQRQ
ncbi:MAG: DNA primase [Bryobacterales bacterium]|nr:DNA primase [Bryobacterales bacterium]